MGLVSALSISHISFTVGGDGGAGTGAGGSTGDAVAAAAAATAAVAGKVLNLRSFPAVAAADKYIS